MTAPHETHACLLQAIERIEAALILERIPVTWKHSLRA